jgi:hypothetical protein
VGAPGVPRDGQALVGAVFLWSGADLLGGDNAPEPLGSTLPWQDATLLDEGGMFGWSLVGLEPSVEGSDELPDLLVGAPRADMVDGCAFLVGGRPGLLGGYPPLVVLHGQGKTDKARFGWSVASGDVDGDGRPDLLVGANGISVDVGELAGDENGRVYVFLATGLGGGALDSTASASRPGQ